MMARIKFEGGSVRMKPGWLGWAMDIEEESCRVEMQALTESDPERIVLRKERVATQLQVDGQTVEKA